MHATNTETYERSTFRHGKFMSKQQEDAERETLHQAEGLLLEAVTKLAEAKERLADVSQAFDLSLEVAGMGARLEWISNQARYGSTRRSELDQHPEVFAAHKTLADMLPTFNCTIHNRYGVWEVYAVAADGESLRVTGPSLDSAVNAAVERWAA